MRARQGMVQADMLVLGTAGHVDHGKSTLVRALTGIDPDRLAEEKRRGLTIELGFAWMDTPAQGAGGRIGLVDVPGHLDFIRNMLAGVTGIDAALLVVGADEGLMPQTREHLTILDLLHIPVCIPVLTKIDAVDDEELLALVELELAEALEATRYARTPIWRASAETGQGMEALATHIRSLEADRTPADLEEPPRLPIDRIFTLSGFGTVVTGTLVSGRLQLGDAVRIMPTQLQGRVRGLQAYRQEADICAAGTRVAVNIGGVPHADIQRGHVLCHPDTFASADLIDVQLRLLPDAPAPLVHDMEVMVFHGAAEVMARVRLMGQDRIGMGEKGFCQLVMASPVVMSQGDRFILRMPSPSSTLGGGSVLEAPARHFWKRFVPSALAHFEALASRDPGVRIRHRIATRPLLEAGTLSRDSGFRESEIREAVQTAAAGGELVSLPVDGTMHLVMAQTLGAWTTFMQAELEAYHAAHPLRRGQPRVELQARLARHVQRQHGVALTPAQFAALLALWIADGHCHSRGNAVALPGHEVVYSETQRQGMEALARRMAAAPYAPPALSEILALLGGDEALLEALLESEAYILLGQDVVFSRTACDDMKARVIGLLETRHTATMAEIRDELATSRKYVQALLEHMDAERLTRRQGDHRILC